MVIGYIKEDKYIITIEDKLLTRQFPIPSLLPEELFGVYKSYSNNYKIISIEDIFGNSYESIDIGVVTNRFDLVSCTTTEIHKITTHKINEIYFPESEMWYYLDKNDAFYHQFFNKKEWRLFENGFAQLCKFRVDFWTIEVFIDNGKVINDLTLYFKDKLKLKVNFDNIDSGEIQFTYFVDGTVEKIENKNKEVMIEEYKMHHRGGIYDLIMSLEYFA